MPEEAANPIEYVKNSFFNHQRLLDSRPKPWIPKANISASPSVDDLGFAQFADVFIEQQMTPCLLIFIAQIDLSEDEDR